MESPLSSRFPFLLTNFPLHCLPMFLMLSSAAPAASLVSATNQFSFQTHVVPRQPSGAHHNMPLFQPTPAASIYSLAVGPSPQWRALLAGVESLDIFHPLPVFVSTLSFFLRINPIFSFLGAADAPGCLNCPFLACGLIFLLISCARQTLLPLA